MEQAKQKRKQNTFAAKKKYNKKKSQSKKYSVGEKKVTTADRNENKGYMPFLKPFTALHLNCKEHTLVGSVMCRYVGADVKATQRNKQKKLRRGLRGCGLSHAP